MTTTQTTRLDIVKEVIDIIKQCEDDGMEFCASMQVNSYLRDTYGYDSAECASLFCGVDLIMELDLL